MKHETKILIKKLLAKKIADLQWHITHHPVICDGNCVEDWTKELAKFQTALTDLEASDGR